MALPDPSFLPEEHLNNILAAHPKDYLGGRTAYGVVQ